jgi:hypothetical protein
MGAGPRNDTGSRKAMYVAPNAGSHAIAESTRVRRGELGTMIARVAVTRSVVSDTSRSAA